MSKSEKKKKKKSTSSCKKMSKKVYKYVEMCGGIPNTDKICMDSYLNVLRRISTPSLRTAVCREYRNHKLIGLGLIECEDELSSDDFYIIDSMKTIQTVLDNGYLECEFPVPISPYNPVLSDKKVVVKFESVMGKPGYYKLRKDSEPIPGLSRQLTNYIIDNASAFFRINNLTGWDMSSMNTKLDYYSSLSRVARKYFLRKEDLEANTELMENLDIRECMLGDLEYMVYSKNCPIFTFVEDDEDLIVFMRKNGNKRRISLRYGTKIEVVTNPSALGTSLLDI